MEELKKKLWEAQTSTYKNEVTKKWFNTEKTKKMEEIKFKIETVQKLINYLGFDNVIIHTAPLFRWDGSKIVSSDNEDYPIKRTYPTRMPGGLLDFLKQYGDKKIVLVLNDEHFDVENDISVFIG